jgi:hypothetical protein
MLNPIGLLLFIVFVGLPAYYINRYVVQVTRPRESPARMAAYFIIILAAAFVITALVCIILIQFVYT